MNLKTKITTIAAASLFALSLGTSALAQSTGKVNQEITENRDPGALSASLDQTSTLNTFKFSLDDGQSNGVLVLNVTDSRGTSAGWNVTLNSTDFNQKTGTNGQPIRASGFKLKDGGSLTAIKGSADGIQSGQSGATFESAKSVLRSPNGKGTGIYKKELNVELAIPGGQAVGTYQADVTVNIAAAPGQ